MWLRYAYGPEQHWGEEDGKLRVVLSAVEPDQMTDMGQDTVFEGVLEFHEWGGTGDIKKEQYDAVKDWERPGPLQDRQTQQPPTRTKIRQNNSHIKRISYFCLGGSSRWL